MRSYGFAFLITLLSMLLAGPAESQSWEVVAQQAIDDQRWDAAISVLDLIVEAQPEHLRARLLRGIAHSGNADFIFDNVRAQYYFDPSEIKAVWQAVKAEMSGQPWELDFGRDYDAAHAMRDFEAVLAVDSTFDGVLWRYANVWHDVHVFDRAIELAEAQIRLKPDLGKAHEELIEIYRHYIAWTDDDVALAWLEAHGTPYADYFIAEVHRKEGRLETADRLLGEMLARPMHIPSQAILLSQARIRIAREQYREAHALIEEALAFDTPVGARLLYRDFFYVMDEAEYAEAQTLETVEAYRDFYDRLWARRNPMPGAEVNWRLVEHFRRLVVAERDFEYFGPRKNFTPPSDRNAATAQPMFTPIYWDAHGLNDKGLVYVRHGEPDERVTTAPRPSVDLNESWRYAEVGLDFHFQIPSQTGTAYSWPLVTYLENCVMAADRQHWGPLYSQVAPRTEFRNPREQMGNTANNCGWGGDPTGLAQARDRLAKVGQERISEGLRTDRHTWETREVESFNFPFDIVTFRGDDGLTDLSVYFALPVGLFSGSIPSNVLPVNVGFAVHDTTWRSIAESSAVREYAATDDPTEAAFESLHVSVEPDSYRVSLNSALVGSFMMGGYQVGRDVPDYARAETMMSDVLLAYDIRPKPGHVPSVRSSMQFLANPFHVSTIDQPVHVYFELYNLALDAGDRSRYDVTYRLEPVPRGGLRGLFSRDAPALSVTARYEDETPSPIVFSEIDVSELDAGEYTLVVQVEDTNGGTEFERRIPLELTAPES